MKALFVPYFRLSVPRPEAIRIPRPPHDEWLQLRRPYFNASAAAALFGEHPFLTLNGIVRSKLAPHTIDVETPAMRRGRHLEPAIADWWAEELDVTLYEPVDVYAARALLATLDRRVEGDDSRAVEIKTTRDTVEPGTPKRSWWWQCQAQMACCPELDCVHLAVLDATMRLQTITVYPDRDAVFELHRRAEAVMVHVNAGRWPPHVPGQFLQLPNRHGHRRPIHSLAAETEDNEP